MILIDQVSVKYFKVPTHTPEQDGTLKWFSTGFVTVEVKAGDEQGLGYTYADQATAEFVIEHAASLILKKNAKENVKLIELIKHECRNLGHGSILSLALSAVDIALWDLKAKLLNVSVQDLLGSRRGPVPFYGSGLFINNSNEELLEQISCFTSLGIKTFKVKIGEGIEKDFRRVVLVRSLLPEESQLYVDANAYYSPKEALALAQRLKDLNVCFFEEPINSHDVIGMNFLRQRFPDQMTLVAGEYCYQIPDVMNLLSNQAVDMLQVDATRCEGVTGSVMASHLACAFYLPVSTHCAPLLHGNLGPCLKNIQIAELFYDHLRIEEKYIDSQGQYLDGCFVPDKDQLGFGWKLKEHKENLTYEQIIA